MQEDSDYTFFVAAKNSVGQSSATSITRRTGLAGAYVIGVEIGRGLPGALAPQL